MSPRVNLETVVLCLVAMSANSRFKFGASRKPMILDGGMSTSLVDRLTIVQHFS
ncbi:hypothetical protein [Thiothrix unzii]|uniref:hypothetical protein n=1 Tax=Thiothrix unzii TaxID=111769 RepID=UPI002A35D056|nr:hypothetical protein [Thiothrix unzii]MDX9988643.1 hypothetical protein [Thiothrix unzii]